MLVLSVAQRTELKARAHSLNPTVMIGSSGLTPAVLDEIRRSLKSHELIKIRVMSDDRAARAAMLEEICTQLNAGAVQHIGKILVIYQPQETPLVSAAPKRKKGKPLTKKQLASRTS
ncbi:MAG TPA: YhbY family RNA-binding protein [Gallionellaceae bacterium]|nr:YhbY family RNA-binding protein [Gallionellaceae bacterium]